jgi:hypothetical protein
MARFRRRRPIFRKSFSVVRSLSEPIANPQHFEEFKSVEDFLHAVATRPSQMKERFSRGYHPEFTLTDSFDEAMTLARMGWREGADKAREMSQRLSGSFPGEVRNRREWRPQVYGGGTLNVASYLQGRPDCYSHRSFQRADKFVRIVMNIGALGSVLPETMIARGVAAAALTDYLELNGYRVSILMVSKCSRGLGQYSIGLSVPLKNYNESLDLDRVAFFTAHPSSLRRLVFSYRETCPAGLREQLGVDESMSYGSSVDVPELIKPTDIYFPKVTGYDGWDDAESAAVKLREILANYGIKI